MSVKAFVDSPKEFKTLNGSSTLAFNAYVQYGQEGAVVVSGCRILNRRITPPAVGTRKGYWDVFNCDVQAARAIYRALQETDWEKRFPAVPWLVEDEEEAIKHLPADAERMDRLFPNRPRPARAA